MKIQCDVCSKKEASIFCSADEAALCHVCDHRVHLANKLASQHERFSLTHPPHAPLCDICQEKRAVLFCQQDRAIMCRDCELPLHTANEHTQKHNRFLLTGVLLNKACEDTTKNDINGSDQVPDINSLNKKPTSSAEISSSSTNLTQGGDGGCSKKICLVDDGDNKLVYGGSTSSISEYLTEVLPGWHFEDFIVDSSCDDHSPFGICKTNNGNGFGAIEEDLSFIDVNLFDKKQTNTSFAIQEENIGIWVPQAPPTILFGEPVNFENNKGGLVQGVRPTTGNQKRIRNNHDGFAVPQITTPNKRIRPLW